MQMPEIQKEISEYRKAREKDWNRKGRGDMRFEVEDTPKGPKAKDFQVV